MARREVVDCDRCEAKAVQSPVTIRVTVGYSPCPAGGPSEADVERLDLCQPCAACLLERAVASLDEDNLSAWMKFARTKVKR